MMVTLYATPPGLPMVTGPSKGLPDPLTDAVCNHWSLHKEFLLLWEISIYYAHSGCHQMAFVS